MKVFFFLKSFLPSKLCVSCGFAVCSLLDIQLKLNLATLVCESCMLCVISLLDMCSYRAAIYLVVIFYLCHLRSFQGEVLPADSQ